MVFKTIRRGEGCRFVIRPNRSLSWKQTKLVYASLATICLVVAAAFTVMGFWLVLPFAGAEVLLLAAGFYLCALSGRVTEVIRIKEDRVAVERRDHRTRESCEFRRCWARIALLPPAIDWYPSRLVIRSHGKQVQLGAFLTDGERKRLADELEQAISSEESFSAGPEESEATMV